MLRYPRLCLLASALLAIGCGHTNKLAEHTIRGQHIIFHVEGCGPGEVSMDVSTRSHDATLNLAADLGSAIASGVTAEKLNHAANSDTLAYAVSGGFRDAVLNYLNMNPVDGQSNKIEYIAETKLDRYSLTSESSGITAYVSARSRIIDRATGKVVWDYCSSQTVPLVAASRPVADHGLVLGALNAAMLSQMSEAEMGAIFRQAAHVVGLSIGEALRVDVATMTK